MREKHSFIPPIFISLLKWAIALGIAFVLFGYVVISLGSIALTFTPYITKTTTVSRPVFVEGTPTKVHLYITVFAENTTKTFNANERAKHVLAILKSHVKGEPQVKLSLYSYKKNNTTYYHLSYSIEAQLKDLNVDWEKLIKECDEIRMSFDFDEKGYEELKEKAEEKIEKMLDEEADKKGKASFFIYLGKRLISESASCGSSPYPMTLRSSDMEIGIGKETLTKNINPGTQEVRCYVYRTYALFGIGFGPNNYD